MSGRMRLVVVLGAVVVGGWLLSRVARGVYFTPRAEIQAKIDRLEELTGKVRAREMDAVRLRRSMEAAADLMLGDRVEVVDHQLRSRLNRIGEQVGLASVVVGTQSEQSLESPARRAMERRGPWRRLRDEPDFLVLPASISGRGTLGQIVELVDRVEAEPWPKQLRYLKLDPDSSGETFQVTLRLATAFRPGRTSSQGDAPAPYDRARLARYDRLVAANPFHIPPPPAEPAPVVQEASDPPPAPAAPPSFPWNEWRVTGVAEGPGGEEVWLRNGRTGESRVLAAGQSIDTAVFVGARDGDAQFRTGDETFLVAVGENLDRRRPPGR